MKTVAKTLALAMVIVASFAGTISSFAPQRVYAQALNFQTDTGNVNQNTGLDVNFSQQAGEGDNEAWLPSGVCPHWYNVGCAIGVLIVYDLWFGLTLRLAKLAAYLSDYMLNLSLQSWVYHNSDFITTGWAIMRDIANIAFIAGLLYAAFRLMMGDGAGKKLVIKVVIFALLINFSLFFTKVVIDGGNILARAIYQNIVVSGADATVRDDGVIRVSSTIVSIANPQRLILGDQAPILPNGRNYLPTFFFVAFVGGVINMMMIFMFISMALIFIGRTVGLMILMIMVPFTILSELIPPIKSHMPVKYLTLDGWMDELWGLVMTAPIYIFFLYLIAMFWSSTANGAAFYIQNPNSDAFSSMLIMTIPILLTFFLLKAAGTVTKKLAGELGSTISAATGAVAGMALGAVAAGVGFVGGKVVGGALGGTLQKSAAAATRQAQLEKKVADGQKLTDDEEAELKKLKSSGGAQLGKLVGAKNMMKAGQKLKEQSFDARKASIGGMSFNQQLQTAGMGSYQGMGGMDAIEHRESFQAGADKRMEKQVARIKANEELIRQGTELSQRENKKRISEYENGKGEADAAKRLAEENKANTGGANKKPDGSDVTANDRIADEAIIQGGVTMTVGSANLDPNTGQLVMDPNSNPPNSAPLLTPKNVNAQTEIADLDNKIKAQDARVAAIMKTAADAGLPINAAQQGQIDAANKAKQQFTKEKNNITADYKKAIETASKTQSLLQLEDAIKKAQKRDDQMTVGVLEKQKTEREGKIKDNKEAIENGHAAQHVYDHYKKDKDKLKQYENDRAARGLPPVNYTLPNRPADVDPEQWKLQKKIEAASPDLKAYAKAKDDYHHAQKDTEKYIKQNREIEIQKLTDTGKKFGASLLKGIAGGIALRIATGGFSALAMGVGAVAGAAYVGGGAKRLNTAVSQYDHYFMDTDYKTALREKLRGGGGGHSAKH